LLKFSESRAAFSSISLQPSGEAVVLGFGDTAGDCKIDQSPLHATGSNLTLVRRHALASEDLLVIHRWRRAVGREPLPSAQGLGPVAGSAFRSPLEGLDVFEHGRPEMREKRPKAPDMTLNLESFLIGDAQVLGNPVWNFLTFAGLPTDRLAPSRKRARDEEHSHEWPLVDCWQRSHGHKVSASWF
jgi:hypothetical protein